MKATSLIDPTLPPGPLDADALAHYARHGFVKMEGWLDPAQVTSLRALTDALAALPEAPGRWMHYFEEVREGPVTGRLLCRTEAFMDSQPELAALLDPPRLRDALAQLLGEPAALFKEKVNYKLPGGGAYAAHQDAPAFSSFGHRSHVSVMVPVEDATPENGGLEVVFDHGDLDLLPTRADGAMSAEAEAAFTFTPLTVRAGDALLFHSFVPHRSGVNPTSKARRAYYLTYNRRSEGDRRAEYVALKRASFPPDCERVPGKVYDAGVFNVGNPIR